MTAPGLGDPRWSPEANDVNDTNDSQVTPMTHAPTYRSPEPAPHAEPSPPPAPAPVSAPAGALVSAPASPPVSAPQPAYVRGPNLLAILVGLFAVAAGGTAIGQALTGLAVDWERVGPLAVSTFGMLLVSVGLTGMIRRRRARA